MNDKEVLKYALGTGQAGVALKLIEEGVPLPIDTAIAASWGMKCGHANLWYCVRGEDLEALAEFVIAATLNDKSELALCLIREYAKLHKGE